MGDSKKYKIILAKSKGPWAMYPPRLMLGFNCREESDRIFSKKWIHLSPSHYLDFWIKNRISKGIKIKIRDIFWRIQNMDSFETSINRNYVIWKI